MPSVVIVCEGPDLTNPLAHGLQRARESLDTGALVQDLLIEDFREAIDLLPVPISRT